MTVYGIAASEALGGIGLHGALPWPKFNEDMQRFKRLTMQSVVIMGRSTHESLKCRTLKGRLNIVVTSSSSNYNSSQENIRFMTLDQTKMFIKEHESKDPFGRLFIIGGAQLWSALLSHIDLFYWTRILHSYNADVFIDTKKIETEFPCVIYESKLTSDGYYFEARRRAP